MVVPSYGVVLSDLQPCALDLLWQQEIKKKDYYLPPLYYSFLYNRAATNSLEYEEWISGRTRIGARLFGVNLEHDFEV